jgi:hypothetical protein
VRWCALPAAIRAGMKPAQIITLLQRPEGAAISELVAETGWQGPLGPWRHIGGVEEEAGPPRYLGKDRRERNGLQT